ncbi:MAG: hypothetical protein JJT90_03565 [Ectothiorhodospiraceae bacterium]|nr:hypothetical protein [Ectothiorhodospiraceae bacterium]
MQQHPDITQLLEVVTAFLRSEIMPNVDGARAFHARVAANALDIVRREVEQLRAFPAQERERLLALPGLAGEGDSPGAEVLYERLCDALAEGRLNETDTVVMDFLWELSLHQLAVDQPKYSGYAEGLRAWDAIRGD